MLVRIAQQQQQIKNLLHAATTEKPSLENWLQKTEKKKHKT